MTIGIYILELHLPLARSLKDKRQVLRRIKDRLRARYNVAVAENPEHSDLWQRGLLTIVSLASDRDALVRLFEAIYREAESGPVQILERGCDFIDTAEGAFGPGYGDEP